MRRRPPRALALFTALCAAAALGTAYASEVWGHLVPCALCLVERWPYRVVIVLGLLAALGPRVLVRPLLALAVVALFADAAVAFVHVGVEQAWWPSPLPECAAPHISATSIADTLAALPARPGKPCDEPTYLLAGVPFSMAAMNLAFSFLLGAFVGLLLPGRRWSSRR
jgi:disulfide bond formation protein DsbB